MRCLLLAFALALIALTGCSLGSDPAEAEDPAASASGPSREVLRMSLWELEPPSFDPAVASDLLSDLFDPLVRMTPNLDARPSMAASWEATPDGKEWTFHLREDGRWSNGDALTAHDYEYAWKRILSPEADTGWAFYFPVRGGLAYYNCKPREESDCDRLRERVAIRASDDHTLSVGLKHRFPRLAHLLTYPAFLPVHQPTVERFGSKWWTPEHIVTSGPFRIASWERGRLLVLERWAEWRSASTVDVERVEIRIDGDNAAALEAFEAGELDIVISPPPEDFERLHQLPQWRLHPRPLTTYLGVNVENIPDVNQRRAMALAIDRRRLTEDVLYQHHPATRFVPPVVHPGTSPDSDFLSSTVDLNAARAYMRRATRPNRSVALWVADLRNMQMIAREAESAWRQLGIETTVKVMPIETGFEILAGPQNRRVDVFGIAQTAFTGDPTDFFHVLTCNGDGNYTNFCKRTYDEIFREFGRIADGPRRENLFARLETMLTGKNGFMPLIPLYWVDYAVLEADRVQRFEILPSDPTLYFSDIVLAES